MEHSIELAALCSGAGVNHTLSKTPGEFYPTITLEQIARQVANPTASPKESADWVLPSTLNDYQARNHKHQVEQGSYPVLILDIDHGNPELKFVKTVVSACTQEAGILIHSTASASLQDKRWRVYIPLNRPCSGIEYLSIWKGLAKAIEKEGLTLDDSAARSGQIQFLPNVPIERREGGTANGKPIFYEYDIGLTGVRWDWPVSLLPSNHSVQEIPEARAVNVVSGDVFFDAAGFLKGSAPATAALDPRVRRFLEENTLEEQFLKYGYKKGGLSSGKQLWRSPFQTSPSHATTQKGEKWVSASQSDSKAINRETGQLLFNQTKGYPWGDSFDLFVAFEHGGDKQSALASLGDAVAQEEPELIPLQEVPKVPAMDWNIVPGNLEPFVRDVAERMQAPPEFVVVPLMCTMSVASNNLVELRPKQYDNWAEPAILWGLIVGDPSSQKSPSLNQGLSPLQNLQSVADNDKAELQKQHNKLLTIYKYQQEVAKKKIKRELEKGVAGQTLLHELPDEPELAPRQLYATNNTTVEKLGMNLAASPYRSVGIIRDEMKSLLTRLDDPQYENERSFYLTGWNGHSEYSEQRVSREDVYLKDYAISLVGGIQPGPLEVYVAKASSESASSDGLIQRFGLAVWPDIGEFRFVDRSPDTHASDFAEEKALEISQTDFGELGYSLNEAAGRHYLHFSDEAQPVWEEWYIGFQNKRRGVAKEEGSALQQHYSKYPGLLARVCLVIHLVDDIQSTEVSAKTLCKGLDWIEFLTGHAEKVYHTASFPALAAGTLILAKLKKGTLPEKFSHRELQRKGWGGLTDKKSRKEGLDLLVDHGYLIHLPGDSAKGEGARYRISKKALNRWEEGRADG